jgi:tRNA modification GTPase
LVREVTKVLASRVTGAGLVSHERQLSELTSARAALAAMRREDRPELVAEHLRAAASGLDRIVGRVGAEDYLDVVFSSFCIGK